ncbi:exodeoxyribonuclease III [Wolbachia endosymbiont of Howardula sp.]|uniref:exodeoxyribonuclease III n=1 Tax=Wolbachia endosymbiont of Howardula sp. TaxID=2916816 RepID=UPI00217EBFCD|nr:exodeoxyribonuclease III [Wolbachia endosymbiont of Howardula sp.]UWI83292.1 exodeoxyribonuclease III [Wolbachia endosymbiont of Howardula sp.]
MIKIATWNVNSIRKRINQIAQFIVDNNIDILLLQEIRCTEQQFPYSVIEQLGYEYAINGQITRNGVCIISKYQILQTYKVDMIKNVQEARYIECIIKIDIHKIRVISVYVPNGGQGGNFYIRKLEFLDNLYHRIQSVIKNEEVIILAGDYNIALDMLDIFDINSFNEQGCFHIQARQKLRAILNLGFKDIFRLLNPHLQEFTWWSYQGKALYNNQGLRIDYILLSAKIIDRLKVCYIDPQWRKIAPHSSDHAPVICGIELTSSLMNGRNRLF